MTLPEDNIVRKDFLPVLELLKKLAALVPLPRVNLVRYHGLLAPHARDREKVVPAQEAPNKADANEGAEN